jgi:serine/threonine protein kinase
MSENLKNFLHRCLEKDPKKRSTIADLMKHPWVTDGGKEPLINVSLDINFEVTENEKQNAMQPRQGKAGRRKNYQFNDDIV